MIKAIFFIMSFTAFISLLEMLVFPDRKISSESYCSRVVDHHLTEGRYGWPDYKNIAAAECPKYIELISNDKAGK